MDNYIVVEGVIGVGKTTLARYLQQTLNATLVLERFDENPFLSSFYADRDLYAFQTQIFFLLSRYQQQQQLLHLARPIVTDYLFAKDRLFARLNLQGDELATYEGLYSALAEKTSPPDLVIYLQASTQTLMNRIALRDRPYERDMDFDYIQSLRVAYDEFFQHYHETPLLIIPADEIDFVASETHRQSLLEQIQVQLADKTPRTPGDTAQEVFPTHFDPIHTPLIKSRRQLPDFQNFHLYLDKEKGFNTDLLLNMLLLQEEMGELAKAIKHYWKQPDTARDEVRNELADVLAYLLKVANYTGIDLEQAYLAKMERNLKRIWQSPEGD